MAQSLAASIYGLGQNTAGYGAVGKTMAFPTGQIIISAAPAATTRSGVTMNSIIEVLPSGLNQSSRQYYTSVATATLVTAANA